MPSLVCSESKLLRAELGVLCHVPRAVHGAMEEPSQQAGSSYPQPGQAEQVPTQGPGAPGQAGPTPGNRTDTPERLEVWNAGDSKTL